MKRTLSYTITNKNKADTIGAFLRDAGYSHRILIELKQNPEQICLNGTPSWLNTPLQIGDTLTLFLPDEPVSSDILPVNLPIDIVYEDEDLIILNKAPGMPVHPSQGHHENTLANGIAWYFEQKGERPRVPVCLARRTFRVPCREPLRPRHHRSSADRQT